MILFLGLAVGIWTLGRLRGVRAQYRMWAITALSGLFAIVAYGVPAVRPVVGSQPASWVLLCFLLAVVSGYRAVLGLAQARANPDQEAAPQAPSDTAASEMTRSARHIMLREIGGLGQRKIKEAKVLVIGAGGLGSPVLQILGGAGVGTIGVIDHDVVDLSNLQRQLIHRDADIDLPKVFSAQAALTAQNPYITVKPYHRKFDSSIAHDLISDYDIVVDGSDSFDTRYLANQICHDQKKPLVLGALSQWEGQLSVFDTAHGTPCYKCIFEAPPAPHLAPTCAEAGVFSPLPNIVGSMMAAEVIKCITGAGQGLRGQMLIYDALYGESRLMRIKANPSCSVCGQDHPKPSA